jgi:DNA mismatch repair protein MutH
MVTLAFPAPAPAPQSEAELLGRSRALAGRTLGELAAEHGLEVPADLRRAKGWVGSFLERLLGATASSRAAPDFEALGIEMKTLPVTEQGQPVESTFVCTIDLLEIGDLEWDESRVWRKLSRVLWVPVLGRRAVPVPERRVGTAFLWTPSERQREWLRFDWEELAGVIGSGELERLTGHLGKCLQVRPKAANSRARRRGTDAEGLSYEALPRGFYLRPSFTARVLDEQFGLDAARAPDH